MNASAEDTWINAARRGLMTPTAANTIPLQLSACGNQAGWLLTLTGPIGVKQLITVEFPHPLVFAVSKG
jgi:hypothetical protein